MLHYTSHDQFYFICLGVQSILWLLGKGGKKYDFVDLVFAVVVHSYIVTFKTFVNLCKWRILGVGCLYNKFCSLYYTHLNWILMKKQRQLTYLALIHISTMLKQTRRVFFLSIIQSNHTFLTKKSPNNWLFFTRKNRKLAYGWIILYLIANSPFIWNQNLMTETRKIVLRIHGKHWMEKAYDQTWPVEKSKQLCPD